MNDKLKHFIVAVVITWVVLLASHLWFPLHYNWDFGLAAAVAIMVSAAKELIWDKWWGRGTPEFDDFLFSLWGAFSAMFAWAIVETIV